MELFVQSIIVTLAACLLSLPLAVNAGPGGVDITDAWIRALPPTQSNTAAYLTVHNRGEQPLRIIGGTVEGVGRVEMHTTREVDGLMRMTPLTTLEVPAGGSLTLAPGGTHLMLLDLARMPSPGEERRLCLRPDEGEAICTRAAVRRDAGGGEHHHHH